jgi:putative oxidoreductase
MGWLSKAAEPIYALLRFVAGGLFACHGAQKVLGAFPGTQGPPMAVIGWDGAQDLLDGVLVKPQLTLFGFWALVGGLLIAVGLFARFAAFIASGEMAVNYFIFHAPGGFWPILNHGEPAVLYCFIFLYIAARGSGPFGIDAMFRKTAAP